MSGRTKLSHEYRDGFGAKAKFLRFYRGVQSGRIACHE